MLVIILEHLRVHHSHHNELQTNKCTRLRKRLNATTDTKSCKYLQITLYAHTSAHSLARVLMDAKGWRSTPHMGYTLAESVVTMEYVSVVK